MSPLRTLRAATLATLLAIPLPQAAAACAFHTALPEATVSERIASAVIVLAARPAADNPFRFAPVAVLKGTAPADAPPQLVDSATRTRLARNPEDAVLFVRLADGTWERLLTLDAATRPVVDRMIEGAGDWSSPEEMAGRRDLFAGLLTHPDEGLRRLALRELDALPYGVLRARAYALPADDLLRGIADVNEMPFAPIRILLLGLSADASADAAIDNQVDRLARLPVEMNLGAWLTAAIERGDLAEVRRKFLSSPQRLSPAQVTEVVRALSVQRAGGAPALHAPIDAALRALAFARPDAATDIARTFAASSDFSQVALIRELSAARAFATPGDLMIAATYVAGAASVAEIAAD
jgi:hypothetical protein